MLQLLSILPFSTCFRFLLVLLPSRSSLFFLLLLNHRHVHPTSRTREEIG